VKAEQNSKQKSRGGKAKHTYLYYNAKSMPEGALHKSHALMPLPTMRKLEKLPPYKFPNA
jgi:hypothetical protein